MTQSLCECGSEFLVAGDGCLCDPEAYDLGPEGQRRYFEDRYCPLHGEAATRAIQASRGCLDPETCRWPGGRCVEPSRCPASRRAE